MNLLKAGTTCFLGGLVNLVTTCLNVLAGFSLFSLLFFPSESSTELLLNKRSNFSSSVVKLTRRQADLTFTKKNPAIPGSIIWIFSRYAQKVAVVIIRSVMFMSSQWGYSVSSPLTSLGGACWCCSPAFESPGAHVLTALLRFPAALSQLVLWTLDHGGKLCWVHKGRFFLSLVAQRVGDTGQEGQAEAAVPGVISSGVFLCRLEAILAAPGWVCNCLPSSPAIDCGNLDKSNKNTVSSIRRTSWSLCWFMLEVFRMGIFPQVFLKGIKICQSLICIYFLVPQQCLYCLLRFRLETFVF